MSESNKDNEEEKKLFVNPRSRRGSVTDSWVPEKNGVTGFTIKGMALLLIFTAIFLTVKYLFS